MDPKVAIGYKNWLHQELGSYLPRRQVILVQVDTKKSYVPNRDYLNQYWNKGRVGGQAEPET